MNVKILEFARQTGISTTDHGRGPFIDDDVSLGDLERFAELIVKECIDICKDVNRNPYLEDEYQARQIIKNIEKHFGVER